MSYNKQANEEMKKHLENNGWKKSQDNESYIKNGNHVRQSESGGSWIGNQGRDTNLSDAKKSKRY